MPSFSTPAIVLRRMDWGDHDFIITLLTLSKGKTSVIAKSAQKSTKRFAGILELFSVLDLVCSRGRGLPVLKEASLKHPFPRIRADIIKTAYASYWAELINEYTEQDQAQAQLYRLFEYVLEALDRNQQAEAFLSILFQMRFMQLCGLRPNLTCCCCCQTAIERLPASEFAFDLGRGGLTCSACTAGTSAHLRLAKGTIKQLLWVASGDLGKAARIRFTSPALGQGLAFLEAFVPYHLGRKLRSLGVLRQIRP